MSEVQLVPPANRRQSQVHPIREENSQNNINNVQQSQSPPKKQSRVRKDQNLCLFWCCIISIYFLSYINFPIFFGVDIVVLAIIGIAIVIFTHVVFIWNGCLLVQSKMEFFHYMFLLDPIFVGLCAAVVGLVGILLIIMPPEGYVLALAFLMAIDLVFFTGNWRMILAYCRYSRWQVIVSKISLLFGCFAYLILAAHFMRNAFSGIPISEEQQEPLKEFFFLYIFGLFTLYLEIFAKMSDLDGTSDLNYYYQIENEDQEKENEEERRSTEPQKQKSRANIKLNENTIDL